MNRNDSMANYDKNSEVLFTAINTIIEYKNSRLKADR